MRTALINAIIVVALLVAGGAASAEDSSGAAPAPERVGSNEAAAIARSQSGGRVLDVRRATEDGRPCYLVRLLLADGRVRIVVVDAESGKAR
jgi:uncharacterized membrane protein YkoI